MKKRILESAAYYLYWQQTGFIGDGIKKAQKRLHKTKLKMFDVFSGSGIVARFFKRFSDLLIVNDIEKYSTVINECYLTNYDELNTVLLKKYYYELVEEANNHLVKGIISELYAPKNDNNIKPNDEFFIH